MKETAGLMKGCPHPHAMVEVILTDSFKKQSTKK
jgi:hypothetical protein